MWPVSGQKHVWRKHKDACIHVNLENGSTSSNLVAEAPTNQRKMEDIYVQGTPDKVKVVNNPIAGTTGKVDILGMRRSITGRARWIPSQMPPRTSPQSKERQAPGDYCDYLLDTLGLNRLGKNCNKFLFDGSDLTAEVLELEKRNFELEEEIGMLKSSTENQMTELQNDVRKNREEVVMLKAQLEETIVAADKCIEELEEQVNLSHPTLTTLYHQSYPYYSCRYTDMRMTNQR